jgi:hypothetical protein
MSILYEAKIVTEEWQNFSGNHVESLKGSNYISSDQTCIDLKPVLQ